MTGTQKPNTDCTRYADGEEDELIFHLELGGTSPPVGTVTTFDEYLFNTHNHIKSSRPVELKGHELGGPQCSSHELDLCSSLHSGWQHLHTLQPSTKVMATQAMEALNRTFIELKSKDEETRLRASYDLRDLVVSAARGEAFYSPRLFCPG